MRHDMRYSVIRDWKERAPTCLPRSRSHMTCPRVPVRPSEREGATSQNMQKKQCRYWNVVHSRLLVSIVTDYEMQASEGIVIQNARNNSTLHPTMRAWTRGFFA
jgi:hypothetical protein